MAADTSLEAGCTFVAGKRKPWTATGKDRCSSPGSGRLPGKAAEEDISPLPPEQVVRVDPFAAAAALGVQDRDVSVAAADADAAAADSESIAAVKIPGIPQTALVGFGSSHWARCSSP